MNEGHTDAPKLRLLRATCSSHRFKDAAESRDFIRRFSKALVEALVRGDGSMAVYVDGQVVYEERE